MLNFMIGFVIGFFTVVGLFIWQLIKDLPKK